MTLTLWQITAPYFCAGVLTQGDRIVLTAPILHWARGKTMAQLRHYLKEKGWKIKKVHG